MISADGRYVIIYNGEVYSHEEIRPSLTARGVSFHGHSDTEVMLESFAAFGVEATLRWLIGMFAITLWDRRERRLWLIRDRMGVKPLYWAQLADGTFLFGVWPLPRVANSSSRSTSQPAGMSPRTVGE